MSEEIPLEEWAKWIRPADYLLGQAYYRILGWVSFHAPISEAIKAIEWLANHGRGGTLEYWGSTYVPAVPWRMVPLEWSRFFQVYSWNDVEVYPGVYMDVWIYGSDKTENVAFIRKRWWNLYLLEDFAAKWKVPLKIV